MAETGYTSRAPRRRAPEIVTYVADRSNVLKKEALASTKKPAEE
jgi:hypothetical protein